LGVERSVLSWLDGVGWETHGQDGDWGANVLDEACGRQSWDVLYWDSEMGVCRAVSLGEIRDNDYNLNIGLYVDTTKPEEDIYVEEELAKLRELESERDEIETRMSEHMEALNYE
jgi:type I restriction-modification system DNA methylase subunit